MSKIGAVLGAEKVQCVLDGVSNATGQMKQCMENSLGILRPFPLSLGTMFLFSISTVHVTCTVSFLHHLKRWLKIKTFKEFLFQINSPVFCTEQQKSSLKKDIMHINN